MSRQRSHKRSLSTSPSHDSSTLPPTEPSSNSVTSPLSILSTLKATDIPVPDVVFIRRLLHSSSRAKSKRIDPPRPPNAFFLFRNALHFHVSNHNLRVPQVSVAAGRLWEEAGKELKEEYTKLQEMAKQIHLEMYPGYVYRPRKNGASGCATGKAGCNERAIRRDGNDHASVSDDGRIDVANNDFVERGNFAKSLEINSRPITPNNHAAFSPFTNCTYENYRPATTGESIPSCMPQPLITSPFNFADYHDAHSDCYYIDNCSNAYRARMACNTTYDGHNTYSNTYKDVYGPPVQTQAHVPHYPGYIHGMVSYHTHSGEVLSSSIYSGINRMNVTSHVKTLRRDILTREEEISMSKASYQANQSQYGEEYRSINQVDQIDQKYIYYEVDQCNNKLSPSLSPPSFDNVHPLCFSNNKPKLLTQSNDIEHSNSVCLDDYDFNDGGGTGGMVVVKNE